MNAPRLAERSLTGPTSPGPVLTVTGLVKSFDGPPILNGVAFALAPGQSTALIGANGSGKSTLLKCLIRLIEPTEGRIEMLGRDVRALGPRDLRSFRAQVGIVWQRHNLVPRLCALSNVVHGVQARLSGPQVWFQALAPAEVRAEAMACLDRVGLADRALTRVDSLSGGQQQRVAIARMLMQRPAFILADEPDASLDPQTGEEVMALLPRIEAALAPFNARPHWGKLFTMGAAEIARVYPRLQEFVALRRRFDVSGKFLNAFLRGAGLE
jgi:phosphonate transport system ATP-binding protein